MKPSERRVNAAMALRCLLPRLTPVDPEAAASARRLARALLHDPSSRVRRAARDLLHASNPNYRACVQWLVLCLDADPACTLLLVDPSPAMAARYSRTLRRGGFEVTSTESLDIALDLIRTVAFDLVIVDTHLGGADGRALLPHLPDTPVIVLSHLRADPLLQLECQALGAAAIYAKPLHPDRLLEAAERVLAIAPRGLSPADPSTARSLALFENRTHLSREEHARLATEDGPPETLAAMRAHLSVCSACRTHHRSHTVGSHTPPRSPTA